MLSLAWREGRQRAQGNVRRRAAVHTPCFAALCVPSTAWEGVLWGREFMGKNAFKQSVDELTAKLQFVSY